MTFPLRDKRESSADEHLDTARLVFLLVADDGHEARLGTFPADRQIRISSGVSLSAHKSQLVS